MTQPAPKTCKVRCLFLLGCIIVPIVVTACTAWGLVNGQLWPTLNQLNRLCRFDSEFLKACPSLMGWALAIGWSVFLARHNRIASAFNAITASFSKIKINSLEFELNKIVTQAQEVAIDSVKEGSAGSSLSSDKAKGVSSSSEPFKPALDQDERIRREYEYSTIFRNLTRAQINALRHLRKGPIFAITFDGLMARLSGLSNDLDHSVAGISHQYLFLTGLIGESNDVVQLTDKGYEFMSWAKDRGYIN